MGSEIVKSNGIHKTLVVRLTFKFILTHTHTQTISLDHIGIQGSSLYVLFLIAIRFGELNPEAQPGITYFGLAFKI